MGGIQQGGEAPAAQHQWELIGDACRASIEQTDGCVPRGAAMPRDRRRNLPPGSTSGFRGGARRVKWALSAG